MYILQNVKLGNSNCVNSVFRLDCPREKGFDYVKSKVFPITGHEGPEGE